MKLSAPLLRELAAVAVRAQHRVEDEGVPFGDAFADELQRLADAREVPAVEHRELTDAEVGARILG